MVHLSAALTALVLFSSTLSFASASSHKGNHLAAARRFPRRIASSCSARGGSSTQDVHGRSIPRRVVLKRDGSTAMCKQRPASHASSSAVVVASTRAVTVASSSSAAIVVSAATSSTSIAIIVPTTVAATSAEPAPTTSIAVVVPTTTAAAEPEPTTTSIYVAPAATSTSTTAPPAAATTTAVVSNGGGATVNGKAALTPNGKKAGIAGLDSLGYMGSHIGWAYDWGVSPSTSSGVASVSMLWGGGIADSTDSSRLSAFRSLSSTPAYILGFEEPDCTSGGGSAGLGVSPAVSLWNELVVPLQNKGALVMSPSMCHQADESGWLQPFQSQISQMWDVTNIHVNKNNMAGVRRDIDHYWNTYGKPIWVSEFACVDDSSSFIPCTDQNEINNYISQIVDLFEADSRVYAYGYSDGMGLGSVWPTVSNGALSQSGQAYLAAISKYH